jgi:hypothetical protein
MSNAGSHQILAHRRSLLFAAAAALTVSSVGPAFGKPEWLVTAEEIATAKKVLQGSSGTPGDDKPGLARQALDAPRGNDTEAEKQQLQGALSADKDTKPSAPSILFVKPVQNDKVRGPVDFEVRFIPVSPARIEPSSVKVIYSGLFDITNRIREFGGRIDADGIVLFRAPLRPDTYRVAIAVADSTGRSARQTVQFTVL